ncbi:MAG TPA: lipopolysaccharide biosynthesis protein [Candidatus Gastranaerophilales bacterium]|nr:lipopolysaccharide biosynthesis protein [Candidatus Gastranaerophilales bacterium]
MENANKLFGAVKWSMLAEISSKAVTPLIFIILARILSPEDFGVTAIAAIIISFSQIFWDAGLNKTLIQRQKDVEETANIVFWTNITLSILIYLVLFVFAGEIAALFKEMRAEAVIKVQGLQIILASLCSVQTALFQKEMNFKPIFWTKFISSALPGFLSIPLALMGFNYWALVAGTLSGSVAQVFILWFISSWRPVFQYNLRIAKELLGFGCWVLGRDLLGWLIVWTDSIIVGCFLTSHELGLFKTGGNFVLIFLAVTVLPLEPIIYSYLSRWQNDFSKFKKILMDANKIVFSIVLFIGLFLCLEGQSISGLLFGSAWNGIGPVIVTTGLKNALTYLVYINTFAYMAINRPDLSTKITVFGLFWYLPLYLYSITISFNCFLWTRLIITIIPVLLQVLIVKKVFKISLISYFNNVKWSFIAGLISFVFIKIIDGFIVNSIYELVFHISLIILVYFLILLFDKDLLNFVKLLFIKIRDVFENKIKNIKFIL